MCKWPDLVFVIFSDGVSFGVVSTVEETIAADIHGLVWTEVGGYASFHGFLVLFFVWSDIVALSEPIVDFGQSLFDLPLSWLELISTAGRYGIETESLPDAGDGVGEFSDSEEIVACGVVDGRVVGLLRGVAVLDLAAEFIEIFVWLFVGCTHGVLFVGVVEPVGHWGFDLKWRFAAHFW